MNDTLASTVPREKKDPTEPVRLPIPLVRKARMIASHRDKSIPDYLKEILEKIVQEDYDQMVQELNDEKRKGRPRA